MNYFLFFIFSGFLLFSADAFASPEYRSSTELLPENSQAIDFWQQTFLRRSSYDETGTELVAGDAESFFENNWTLKYNRGIYPELELAASANFRYVKSESETSSATNSGLESLALGAKFFIYGSKRYKHAINFHFKNALFSNTKYNTANPPPTNKVALGDDGQEKGADYLFTLYTKRLRYDFKLGYNKPSSTLSSELPFNIEVVGYYKKLFLLAGFGGIYSLKNDPYAATPDLKPSISSGNSRLYNSINREKNYLYIGTQYAFGDFIIGAKAETIISGKYTDKGETITFNIRWEKKEEASKMQTAFTPEKIKLMKKYFAEGYIEKVAPSGNMIKVNIGTTTQVELGNKIDVFDVQDESKATPIASGIVIKVGPNWAIVSIKTKLEKAVLGASFPIKVY